MDLYLELLSILKRLDAEGLDYALCGGLAVAFYGYARFTKDIHLLIPAAELARVKSLLRDLGYDLDAGMLPFDWGTPKAAGGASCVEGRRRRSVYPGSARRDPRLRRRVRRP